MFWEAAEGGTGVWEVSWRSRTPLPRSRGAPLRSANFASDTGEESSEHDGLNCAVSCYECLLTYANQLQHRFLDRNIVRDFLVGLGACTTTMEAQGRSRDEQYEWLRGLTDPHSSLEPQFLEFVYDGGYNLPLPLRTALARMSQSNRTSTTNVTGSQVSAYSSMDPTTTRLTRVLATPPSAKPSKIGVSE